VKEKVGVIRLIVGLGNPGPHYTDTRHNAGVWFTEALCTKHRLTLKIETKFNARVASWSFGGKECKILVPNTYMNHSGQPVSAIAKYYQIPTETILIAHDELDIPPGTVRFKTNGGHGGHNGLRDIIHHLKSPEFHRLRLGIGHPGHKDEVADYVLQSPSKTEEQKIRATIDETLKILPQILMGDWQAVMHHLHSFTN
jgi:PTH1 family peptidyl-tRNA hydrolase